MAEENQFIVTGDRKEFERKRQEEGVYDATVTTPDRYINPEAYGSVIYRELSENIDWSDESYRLLDLGSSSGEAVSKLAERLEAETEAEFEAYALDVDREMMERCFEYSESRPVSGKAQQLPFRDRSIDILVSNQLNLIPEDIERVVEEANRVLRPDGAAVLAEGYELPEADYTGLHRGNITE
ncbi:MAG: class I SAM-dependent methyltransferase [Candidatus Nanohalobium sp.]